jgi:hypothetical protein
MGQAEQQVSRNLQARTGQAEEWLDDLIVETLTASFGNAQPRMGVWARICERIPQPQRGAVRRSPRPIQQEFGRYEVFRWSDVLAQQEHCEDIRREAARHRIAQQASEGQKHNHLHCRALSWLGGRMVALGQRMQERYGAAATAPAFQAAN